jgi:two-component system, OmpR family, phosphate regulon sensor histidine kinase PhoR
VLPGEDVYALLEQAASEVEQITELIDEVLFLSELESGARVVSLGATAVRPVIEEALEELTERAERAGVALRVEGNDVELAIRPRMLRVVAQNLAENAIRYAGPDSTFILAVERAPSGAVVLVGQDDGVGVGEAELPRLFERFYRSDRARASRGTGLGLAIVKHVVTQAGGSVEARRGVPQGLEIRCTFP